MYHCPVTFYLVGLPDEIARIIEDAQPQPSLRTIHAQHEPEEALTAQASAIFADATGHDAAAWARVFAAHRQATTTVTLIVTHDQVPAVEPYFNDIADLWIAPLSAAEASCASTIGSAPASATPTPGRRASIWKPPSTLFRRLYGTSPRTASTTRSTTPSAPR